MSGIIYDIKIMYQFIFFSIKLLKWKILAQKYLSPVVYFLSADVRKSYAIAYQCLFSCSAACM